MITPDPEVPIDVAYPSASDSEYTTAPHVSESVSESGDSSVAGMTVT